MRLLVILHIFALFVLFSPNVLIKANKQYLFYSICFSLIFYFTIDLVQHKQHEGATFNAYDVHGNKYDIDATNVNLGDVQLEKGSSSLDQQSRIIYTEPPSKNTENILTNVPPLFSNYQLEKNLNKVMEHGHEEKERLTSVYCAANYGENTTCCGQPATEVPIENQCPKHKPICSGYVAFEKWGQCISNDDTIPNLQHREKKKETCLNKNKSCPAWKQCCPGGKGSNKETKCGTDDCPLDGKPCVGSWMKENCPRTCGLCEDGHQWDGNIGGKYIVEKKVEEGNDNSHHYASVQKSKDNNNTYVWKSDSGTTYVLQRISNTHDYIVVGDEYNDWKVAKVHLDYNDHVKYIIGPNNDVYVKQS
jgi:hypothetical protein